MIRFHRTPSRVAALALLGLASALVACTDDITTPDMTVEEEAEAQVAPSQVAMPSLDPMVDLLIGSMEDARTARSLQGWLEAELFDARPGLKGSPRDATATVWSAEPTNPHDLVTLDVLRLLMADVPQLSKSSENKEIVR